MPKWKNPVQTSTISFRVRPEVAAEVEKKIQRLAAKHHHVSRHEFAKQVFIDALFNVEQKRVRLELEALRQKLFDIERQHSHYRSDVATLATMLLVEPGGMPVEEATEWVKQHFPNSK